MRSVKVKRDELLAKVRTNRDKHVAEFDASVTAYKAAALEALAVATEDIKQQITELQGGDRLELDIVTFGLNVPTNHVATYDQVIVMLEMSVDTELTLGADEFSMYVMDKWNWSSDFDRLKTAYGAYGATGPTGPQGACGATGPCGAPDKARLARLRFALAGG